MARTKIVPTGRVVEALAGLPLDRVSTRMVGWDTEIKVWNSRIVMARAIRMQENAGTVSGAWRAWVRLTPGEGF